MKASASPGERGTLYVLSLSLHGLLRGERIELGRDPDTGGQVSYVVDQARALAALPGVEHVDLVTRQIVDRRVDADYARPHEAIADRASIVRIPFGPRRYLRKESLWVYLDGLVDRILHYLRSRPRPPDVIHAHYADAGYVGAHLSGLLEVPLVYTGHSLGRVKRARLLAKGSTLESIERRYDMRTRIDAEESALMAASLVVASTGQEVTEQYALYDHYAPERMEVIPPGVDLGRFSPPDGSEETSWIAGELRRFLEKPEKPIVLALARPDERKNFSGLVTAFAETEGLREAANLVLVAGTREDLLELPAASRRVLMRVLYLIDRHDLYGSVACPKSHRTEDVPDLFRLAARRMGVFVNVALTEPFGLTLLEAAASGLPVVATQDGGPRDIVATCRHGELVDPLDTAAVGRAILDAVTDRKRWSERSENGLRGVRSYTWTRHVERYLEEVNRIRAGARTGAQVPPEPRSRLASMDRILVADLDDTLTGDDEGLRALVERLRGTPASVGFAISTGRLAEEAAEIVREQGLPVPDIVIACVGTEIRYGLRLSEDRSWTRHIERLWDRAAVVAALEGIPGLELQENESQRRFKVSYVLDPDAGASPREVVRALRRRKVRARTVHSLGAFVDIVPMQASPGQAIRFLSAKWNLPLDRVLAFGDSGSDEDMLSGDTLGVVVGNYSPELEPLRGAPRVYFAEGRHAWGVLEGIDHYDFLDAVRIPGEEQHEAVPG